MAALNSIIRHYGLWRRTEHIGHSQIDRPSLRLVIAVHTSVSEHKTMVAGGTSHLIHRSTFAVCYAANSFHILTTYNHTHTFLGFIAYDFLVTQCRIAHRKSIYINISAGFFHQF